MEKIFINSIKNHAELLRVTPSITRRYPLCMGGPFRGLPNKGITLGTRLPSVVGR